MIKEKIKNYFDNLKEKNKTENLIAILIILVIFVIVINIFFSSDENKKKTDNTMSGKELATEINKDECNDMEQNLKNILSKIDGVGEVDVLITYSETNSVIPIYNEKNVKSTTEEVDTNGGTRVIESFNEDKEVVSGNNSEPITQKIIMPKIEGAIITAEGAENSEVKNNIISAVEAATGIANHKIKVFKMK